MTVDSLSDSGVGRSGGETASDLLCQVLVRRLWCTGRRRPRVRSRPPSRFGGRPCERVPPPRRVACIRAGGRRQDVHLADDRTKAPDSGPLPYWRPPVSPWSAHGAGCLGMAAVTAGDAGSHENAGPSALPKCRTAMRQCRTAMRQCWRRTRRHCRRNRRQCRTAGTADVPNRRTALPAVPFGGVAGSAETAPCRCRARR